MTILDTAPTGTSRPRLQFFTSPSAAAFSFVIGVFGIVLAIFGAFFATPHRQLTVVRFADSIDIVFNGDLQLSYKGKKLPEGVTVDKIAIWNAGALDINQDDIHKLLSINYSNNRIFSWSWEIPPREETHLVVDGSSRPGVLQCNWKVLEHDDGGVLLVVRENREGLSPSFSASIRGSSGVNSVNEKVRSTQYWEQSWWGVSYMILLVYNHHRSVRRLAVLCSQLSALVGSPFLPDRCSRAWNFGPGDWISGRRLSPFPQMPFLLTWTAED